MWQKCRLWQEETRRRPLRRAQGSTLPSTGRPLAIPCLPGQGYIAGASGADSGASSSPRMSPPSNPGLSHMQPEIDAQLSNFFEEATPREFARVMRGYDPHQVDEHFKQLDSEVRQHRDQVGALQQELSDAHRQIREQERPTYAGLGSRI